MQTIIRYSCSGVFGGIVTASLFIGMLNLLGVNYNVLKTDIINIGFSFIEPDTETHQRKRIIKKPPEFQKSSQPPAAPRLNIAQNNNAMLNLPNSFDSGKNLNVLNKTNLPGLDMHLGSPNIDSQGSIKAAMPPIYPPAALFKNKEGWVKVLISVNEMGMVSDVVVLDAKPAYTFNEAAIKAVKKWSFYQKKENNLAVPFEVTQVIEFTIEQPLEEN